MHARHRLHDHGRIVRIPFPGNEITVNAQPVHLAPAAYLLLAHHLHIVLAVTRDNAHVTARAGIQVDDHPPLILVIGVFRDGGLFGRMLFLPERGVILPFFLSVKRRNRIRRKRRVFPEFREGGLAEKRTPFHVAMLLRGGNRPGIPGRLHLGAGKYAAHIRTTQHRNIFPDSVGKRAVGVDIGIMIQIEETRLSRRASG